VRQWLKKNVLNLIAVILAAMQVWQNGHREQLAPVVGPWKAPWGWIIVGVLLLISALINTFGYKLRRQPPDAENDARNNYRGQLVLAVNECAQLKHELNEIKNVALDSSIKDSDPQIEIKLADLRGKTMSDKAEEQACFDLINRGKQSPAKFVCIEDFNIGGYRVAFRSFPPSISPFANHGSIFPLYINKPDGKLCTQTIFTVFSVAWSELHNPQLYELAIPIKATYQDEGRTLFEVRCDLVFYPLEHAERCTGKMGNTVIETKNHKWRKVAPASHPVDWS
jgi:hypothetical protein